MFLHRLRRDASVDMNRYDEGRVTVKQHPAYTVRRILRSASAPPSLPVQSIPTWTHFPVAVVQRSAFLEPPIRREDSGESSNSTHKSSNSSLSNSAMAELDVKPSFLSFATGLLVSSAFSCPQFWISSSLFAPHSSSSVAHMLEVVSVECSGCKTN
jgi:hypothetical protein